MWGSWRLQGGFLSPEGKKLESGILVENRGHVARTVVMGIIEIKKYPCCIDILVHGGSGSWLSSM